MECTTHARWGGLLLVLLSACGGKDNGDDSGGPEQPEDTGPFDVDGDGYTAAEDCDDANPLTYPGAQERCDAADQDCDGAVDEGSYRQAWVDADGDGYGDPESPVEVCSVGEGLSLDNRDCDDSDAEVSPRAEEDCDFVDDDCDGLVDEGAPDAVTWYADSDGDGFGDPDAAVQACEGGPSGTVMDDADCDDGDASVYPGAAEICDDGVVNDCDGDAEAAWAACGLVGAVDLTARVASLTGPGADRFGYAVAGAGDVNADGYGDVIVGANLVQHADILDGSAYLFHGPFSGGYTHVDAAAEIRGEAYEAYMGVSVMGPGDLNGDGYDDLVIGSMHSQLGFDTSISDEGGGLHVLFGPLSGLYLQSQLDVELRIDEGHNHLGVYTAYGDVNHDGYTDILGTTTIWTTEDVDDQPLVVYLGPFTAADGLRTPDADLVTRADDLPRGLAVGDLDGDGGDDIALAPQPNGSVAIYHGPLSSGSRQNMSGWDAALSTSDGEDAGESLVVLPDANGDGYSDLAVGAMASAASSSGGGAVFLVMGPISTGDLERSANGVIFGSTSNWFARHEMDVGDHDGDGLTDLYVQTGSPSGRVSAVPGDLSGAWDVEDAALWSIVRAANVGDVDGAIAATQLDDDPWPELLIGTGDTSGQVSIIDGVGY